MTSRSYMVEKTSIMRFDDEKVGDGSLLLVMRSRNTKDSSRNFKGLNLSSIEG